MITLLKPNGGEVLPAGQPFDITWNASDDVGVTSVDIYMSISGDDNYGVILYGNLPNTGSVTWNVPNQNMLGKLKIIAYDADGNSSFDVSNAPFSISTYCPPAGTPNIFSPGRVNTAQDYSVYWSGLSNAVSYIVHEDTNPGFFSPHEYQTNENFYTFTGKTEPTYYYRVRAKSSCSGAVGGWSKTEVVGAGAGGGLRVTGMTPSSRNLSNPDPIDVTITGEGFQPTPTAVLRQSGPRTLGTITGMDGDAQDIVISGDYAYVATGNEGLMTFDISTPGKLHFRSSLKMDYPVVGVAINGDIAYASMGVNGLTVVNVSDRSRPAILNTVNTIGTVGKMVIDGNYLYIAALEKGMLIYDISNPADPVFKGRYFGTETYGMKIIGDMAYVADGDTGIMAVNISDRANPYWAGGYNTPGKAYNLYLTDQYAYVADGSAGIQILSRPSATSFIPVGSLDTAGTAFDISGDDTTAYVADGSNGALIVDVSDPVSPIIRETYKTKDKVRSFAIKANFHYIADGRNGILSLGIDPVAPKNLTIIGSIGSTGSANDIFVQGNYAYLADGPNGFKIIDISFPNNPVIAGSYTMPGVVTKIHVVGNFAYLSFYHMYQQGMYRGGLKVVDISDPANPVLISTLSYSDYEAHVLYVVGNYVYLHIANINSYILKIIEISDPSNPTEIGFLETSSASDIYVADGYAYIAGGSGSPGGGSGLRIIDISNPINPTLVSFLYTAGYSESVYVVGHYAYLTDRNMDGFKIVDISDPVSPTMVEPFAALNIFASANGVFVVGNYAYVADWTQGLKVINIFDSTNPILTDYLDTDGLTQDVFVAGGYAYLADGSGGFKVIELNLEPGFIGLSDSFEFSVDMRSGALSDGYFYTAQGKKGLRVYDISHLEDSGPKLVSSLTTNDAQGVAISSNTLYLTDGISGLRVVDITNPLIPMELGQVDTINARSVIVDNNYAYVADGSGGFQVIDVTEPASPVIVGTQGGGDAYRMEKCGDTVYLADGTSGLRVMDVSAPSSPVLLGTYNSAGTAYGVAVNCTNGTAYLAAGIAGVLLLDISDPASPLLMGEHNTLGTALDVLHDGYRAVVADGDGDLRIIDFYDFFNPVDLGRIVVPGNANNIFRFGNTAYVALDGSGYGIIDITTPVPLKVESVLVGLLDTYRALNIHVSANYVYLADSTQGFKIIDVSDPTSPILVGSLQYFDNGYDVKEVKVLGAYAYLLNENSGLRIIDISDPTNPIQTGSGEFQHWATFNNASKIDVAGNYAYITYSSYNIENGSPRGYGGISIIDISDPTNPFRAGTYRVNDYAIGIDVVGDYAYFATKFAGLTILNISNPVKPVAVGTFRHPGISIVGLYGTANSVFLIERSNVVGAKNGLKVIDVTNPVNPTLTGSLDTFYGHNMFYLEGQYLYIAAGNGGLKMIDVEDPKNPFLFRELDTSGYAYGMYALKNHVYVADGNAGLKIVKVDNEVAFNISLPTFISSNILDAQGPAIPKPGLYDLVLTNPDNEIADRYNTFEVIDDLAPVLTLSQEAGEYCGNTQITITSDEDAYLYYTTDGTEPTLSSTSVFKTQTFTLTADFTLKVFAVDRYDNQSTTITRSYIKDVTPPVSFAFPTSTQLCKATNITLKASEEATLYYTMDGSIPTVSSPSALAPASLYIDKMTSINFFAKDSCGNLETVPAMHSESYMIGGARCNAPVAVDDSVTTNEDTPVTTQNVMANDTDLDADTLTINGFTQPTNGSVLNNNDGTFTYTPSLNFNGIDRFTYILSDNRGGEDTGTVNITVNPVNDPPTAVNDSGVTDEDSPVTLANLLANDSDADGDLLSITGFTQPANGMVTEKSNGTFIYTPNLNFNGTDRFTYNISDGNGGTDTASVAIVVTPVPDAPTASNGTISVNLNTPISGRLQATDYDGDALAYQIVTNGSLGTATITNAGTGDFIYVPNIDVNGIDTFTFKVNDGVLDSNIAVFSVIIPVELYGIVVDIATDSLIDNVNVSAAGVNTLSIADGTYLDI